MRNRETKELFAVKAIDKFSVRSQRALQDLRKEVEIHKSLVHDNIIRMHEAIESKRHIMLVLEYAPHGDLFKSLRKRKQFTEQESFLYFTQVCNALHFMHKHKLIHRDIKPENLLLTSSSTLKLCDFGCCAQCVDERKTFCGTVEYIAPEILKRAPYNEKADIWSLGVLLFEMIHGYTPFKGIKQNEVFSNILSGNFSFSAETKDDLKDLIKRMVSLDPKSRPSVEEILEHKWIRRLQGENPEKRSLKLRKSVEDSVVFGSAHSTKETYLEEDINFHTEGDIPRHLLYDYPDYKETVKKLTEKLGSVHLSKKVKVVNLSKTRPVQKKVSSKDETDSSFWSFIFPSVGGSNGL